MKKPTWDMAPPWANYLAQDADGYWCWYRTEPECDMGLGMWEADADDFEFENGSRARENPEWHKTLEARPASGDVVN